MDTFCEGDDECIHEVDVFLSKTLFEKLYLFHYPSKHSSEPPKPAECLSAKVKPMQQKLELEFALETDASNYDKSKGELLAHNVDGSVPSGEPYFKSSMMDKYVLSGEQSHQTSVDNYAIGFVRRGELHLTPLYSILELKENFKYMDKMDNSAKKSLAATEEEEEAEAVAVTVRFEGPNAERDKQMREKSFQYLQQKSANEAWVDLNYHPFGSHRSKLEFENLTCSHMYREMATSGFNPEEYRKNLLPESLRHSSCNTNETEMDFVSQDQPISDQIKKLMINAHVLKFSTILEKMPFDVDIVSVERLIQQIAVLVQGCWVVKSELLYVEDAVSPLTGVIGKYLISARDYVVWLFTKSRTITRREVLSAICIPDEELKSMISEIAVQTDKDWEFKFPYDADFVERHRSIEQSQEIKWDLRYKKLVKELNLGMCDSNGQVQKLPFPVPPRKQKRLSRSSFSEDGDESGPDSSSFTHREAKCKRLNSPKKRVNLSPSKHPSKSSKPYHIATLNVSPTFLETSPSDDIKSQLKECVEEAIRNQFVMTLTSLKELVSESHLNALCLRNDFEQLLEEALFSCGAQKLKNKWPQNTTPEPLFAVSQFGNKLDRYRNILLELFSTTARTRTNLFVKSVEDELSEIISEHDCAQIFEEYCTHKSGFFYLKGTISPDS